jgi:CMP-N-acetylneuraminic acid synthetase
MAPDGKTVLAVIPARSGSKRCPGKNFREFRGKTLLAWAQEAAAGSSYIDTVKLSLDADRPPELCTDEATCEDVLRHHMVDYPEAAWIVLLQPTSPLRTAEDIDRTIEKAVANGSGAISTYHYKTNGAVYVATAEWLAEHEFSHAGLAKYEMEESHSLDINYPEDFDDAAK